MPDFSALEQNYQDSARPQDPASNSADSLLTLPEDEVAKRSFRDWQDSYKYIQPYVEQWKINRARSLGYTGVALLKKQDTQEAYIPTGAIPNVAGLNKANRLRRRLRATLFADAPLPDCTPAGDEPEKRDAAEFSSRVLTDVCSEGNLDFPLLAADAFDVGADYGSGFLRFYVDEQAGGWRPKQTSVTQPDGSTQTMYETVTGEPTDDPTSPQVAKEWLPKLKAELLNGKHVRFLPYTARDLWEAEAVLVGALVPLGTVKSLFPSVAQLSEADQKALTDIKPTHGDQLLPPAQRKKTPTKLDEQYVFVCSRYHVQCGQYPLGAYLITLGDKMVAYRSTWYDTQHQQPLDIPLTQFMHFRDEDCPYGIGSMQNLGPGNEIRSLMFGTFLEHLDRFANRRLFVPMTSMLTPEQLQSPTGTPIPIVPGTEPVVEQIPDFPRIAEKMFSMASGELDDEASLPAAAQGLAPPTVESGKHQDLLIQQGLVGLSDLRQNCERALVRGWRVMLQLIRAYYTTSQRIQWVGDDGAYKEREWTGADLGDTRDVRLLRGSFTQLSPIAKANLAQQYAQLGLPGFGPMDLESFIGGSVGGYLGIQDNPHRLRVRRQVSAWRQGPPQGWMPPQPQVASVDPTSGQPIMQPPPPSPVFAPLPVDDEPTVARLRAYELGRAVAASSPQQFGPEWQQELLRAYQGARVAAGIQTIAEQQAAQAQAMQQQAAQKQQQEAQRAQERVQAAEATAGAKVAQLNAQREAELSRAQGNPSLSPR